METSGTVISGRVWKYGDNVNTDEIIPATYLNTTDEKELAAHCMEAIDPTFAQNVSVGDILVGGTNFGCGSSREHAPIAIKAASIACVVAASFARIFYRNSINMGLPILECKEAVDEAEQNDEMTIDIASGTIQNLTRNKSYEAAAFPEFMQAIIAAGGLIPWVKEHRLKNG